jgi:Uma2 family endonuclease
MDDVRIPLEGQPMATTTASVLPVEWTVEDLLNQLGCIPLKRIRAVPPPGTATEQDVLAAESRTGRICELIDGVLVEKTTGYYESLLAALLIRALGDFVEQHQLGIVLGPDGTLQILPHQVRIPDVSFIAWDRFPDRRLPKEPIPAVAPDLAVEVLSEGNTPGEMQRKLRDYFQAGVRLVWYLDPQARAVTAYTAPDRCDVVGEDQILDGADVLPGFRLSLRELFARAEGKAGSGIGDEGLGINTAETRRCREEMQNEKCKMKDPKWRALVLFHFAFFILQFAFPLFWQLATDNWQLATDNSLPLRLRGFLSLLPTTYFPIALSAISFRHQAPSQRIAFTARYASSFALAMLLPKAVTPSTRPPVAITWPSGPIAVPA